MKKLILALFLTLSSFLYSQSLVTTYAVQVGAWSEKIDDWIYQDWVYTEHQIYLEGYFVYVNDQKESTYETYGDPEVIENFFVWTALDENSEDCLFIMNDDFIIITYLGDFTIKYAIKKTKTKKKK